jgi:hypothetical protein
MHDASGRLVGHVLVEQETWWSVTGALWWKRWTEPTHEAVAYLILDGAWEERFLGPDELNAALVDWERGIWVETDEGAPSVSYRLTWLPPAESAVAAREQLGMDVDWLRRHHKHPGARSRGSSN